MAEKIKKTKLRKILEIVFWSIFGLFFVGFAYVYIGGLVTKEKNFGVPEYFGYQVMVVQTDSMEDEYPVGCAVFVKKVDPETLEIGDDITFYYSKMVYTHRLYEITVEDGVTMYHAHGINKASTQCGGGVPADCTYQHQDFPADVILGKVVGKSVFVGGVYNFMTSVPGLLVLLLLPTAYIITSTMIDLYKKLKEEERLEEEAANNGPSPSGGSSSNVITNVDSSVLSDLSPEEKERLKQELLNEMLEERSKKNGK